jgi:SAM-dependent methyltransferase
MGLIGAYFITYLPTVYGLLLVLGLTSVYCLFGIFRISIVDILYLLLVLMQATWVAVLSCLSKENLTTTRYFSYLPSFLLYLLAARLAIESVRLSEWIVLFSKLGRVGKASCSILLGTGTMVATLPLILRYHSARMESRPRSWVAGFSDEQSKTPPQTSLAFEYLDTVATSWALTLEVAFLLFERLGWTDQPSLKILNASEELYGEHFLDKIYQGAFGAVGISSEWIKAVSELCGSHHRILDIGAGTGRLLPLWREICAKQHISVTLLEPNRTFFQVLVKSLRPSEESWLFPVFDSFPKEFNKPFDLAVLHQNTFLELLSGGRSLEETIRELSLIISPNGCLIFDYSMASYRFGAGDKGTLFQGEVSGLGFVKYSYLIQKVCKSNVQSRLSVECHRSDEVRISAEWNYIAELPEFTELASLLRNYFVIIQEEDCRNFVSFYPGTTKLVICRRNMA